MEFDDHTKANPGGAQLWESCRRSVVRIPPVHHGVGDALRVAYVPSMAPLPADIIALLERLR
jgi:hypothetical protein